MQQKCEKLMVLSILHECSVSLARRLDPVGCSTSASACRVPVDCSTPASADASADASACRAPSSLDCHLGILDHYNGRTKIQLDWC